MFCQMLHVVPSFIRVYIQMEGQGHEGKSDIVSDVAGQGIHDPLFTLSS